MPKLITVIGIIGLVIGIIGIGIYFIVSTQDYSPSPGTDITLSAGTDDDSAHMGTVAGFEILKSYNFELVVTDIDGDLTISLYIVTGDTFTRGAGSRDLGTFGTINEEGVYSYSAATNYQGDIYLYFEYTGTGDARIDVKSTPTWLLPLIIGGIGLLLGIILLLVGRRGAKPKVAARPLAQPLYEPSLGARGSTFATTSASAPKKKGKKKAREASTCPYCGKTVDSSLVYCPHCYSKMK